MKQYVRQAPSLPFTACYHGRPTSSKVYSLEKIGISRFFWAKDMLLP
jgi:hypothetical protein